MGDPLCDSALIVQEGRNNSMPGLGNTEAQLEATKVVYFVGIAIYVVCLGVWLLAKYKYERTRVRPTIFLVLAIASALSTQSCGPLQLVAKDSYPCWLGVILLLMVVPFAAASILLRYMLYSFLSRFAQGATRVQSKLEQETTMSVRSTPTTAQDRIRSSFNRWKNLAALLFSGDRVIQSEAELYDLRFLTSPKGVFTLVFILTTPVLLFALVILATDPVLTRCYNCGYSDATQTVLIALTVSYFVISLVFWYSARKTKAEDKWGIKSECFRCLLAIAIAFIGFIASLFDLNPTAISPYTHQFMMVVGFWLLAIEQSLVQVFLAWREERRMKEFKVIGKSSRHVANASTATQTNSGDDLEDILNDKALADLFEKHLVAEFGVESLFFLRQCEEWRKAYFDVSPTARVARARKIYKSYINTSGLYSVNVPANVHDRVKRKLMTEPAPDDCTREIFDEAIEEIRQLLLSGAVLRFKASSDYRRHQAGDFGNSNITTSMVHSTGVV